MNIFVTNHMTQELTQLKALLETRDDTEEQPQIYAKNSFDRFGDDLCGLILSFSPQKHRYRYECVSKQFQRTVFVSVVNVIISDGCLTQIPERYVPQMLATITTKCPNIEIIDCRRIDTFRRHVPTILTTFRDNCHNLRHIYCSLLEGNNKWLSEYQSLVTRIGSIDRTYSSPYVQRCQRLTKIVIKSLRDGFSPKRPILTTKLEKLSFRSYDGISGGDNQLFAAVVANNQSLTRLSVHAMKPETVDIMTEFADIVSQNVPQLRRLSLYFDVTDIGYSLDASLRTIGVKCKQLKILSLGLRSCYGQSAVQTFNSLQYFSRLKRLSLKVYAMGNDFESYKQQFVDPLKHCHRLTHLSLELSQMSGQYFWPRLQYLFIRYYKQNNTIDNEFVSHISRLPALQTLVIQCNQDIDFSANDLNAVLSSSPKLKNIEIRRTQLMTSLETTDDGNEDNYRQQTQIYAKDSLDRFGDDLFGLLLSYLSLEDRFRCECVSKQFQRTAFDSVIDININDRLMRQIRRTTITQTIPTIATKCPNIETIDCRGINKSYDRHIPEVLDIFHDNCRHLREIYYNLRQNYYQWIPKLGTLVTRIGSISAKHSLIHCHRLSHLTVDSILKVFDNYSGELMAKNLLGFEFRFSDKHIRNQLLWTLVADNQSLQSVAVNEIKFKAQDTITELIQQLSRLPQLRELTLEFRAFPNQDLLSDSLRTIGVNCKQLQRLSLRLNPEITEINVQIWDPLKVFRRLKRLKLIFTSQLMSLWIPGRKLTHLWIKCSEMNSNLLVNCHELWPRLQYLSIKCRYIDGQCLDHISRLRVLQTLVIQCYVSIDLKDNDFWDLLSRSPKLKNIEIIEDFIPQFKYIIYNNMAQQTKHNKTSLETTDDSNEDKPQNTTCQPLTMIYAKNSMDRFGDEVNELLLSHLLLEDRFRFECVSKQFQRTVFESVVCIDINDQIKRSEKESIGKMLATIAIKCPNIEIIDCRGIGTKYEKHWLYALHHKSRIVYAIR
ncbi:unnamed protein product [Medioppia subpectinata]|uniref:F-box domain-containing protein n=1 Tax=Medioppia subpectinata TaxID=1979941 RepID=A0A7R9KFL4_9ACAR|nr:unnamed protein product [Medioppia subpectinata]CAG2102477.1 unnamed protein product [Medioppia subpectinata]